MGSGRISLVADVRLTDSSTRHHSKTAQAKVFQSAKRIRLVYCTTLPHTLGQLAKVLHIHTQFDDFCVSRAARVSQTRAAVDAVCQFHAVGV